MFPHWKYGYYIYYATKKVIISWLAIEMITFI